MEDVEEARLLTRSDVVEFYRVRSTSNEKVNGILRDTDGGLGWMSDRMLMVLRLEIIRLKGIEMFVERKKVESGVRTIVRRKSS